MRRRWRSITSSSSRRTERMIKMRIKGERKGDATQFNQIQVGGRNSFFISPAPHPGPSHPQRWLSSAISSDRRTTTNSPPDILRSIRRRFSSPSTQPVPERLSCEHPDAIAPPLSTRVSCESHWVTCTVAGRRGSAEGAHFNSVEQNGVPDLDSRIARQIPKREWRDLSQLPPHTVHCPFAVV